MIDQTWREFLPSLTRRERETFDLIGQGLKNTEIAAALGISVLTVRIHAKRIHDKLYIEGRSALAIAAFQASLEGGKDGIPKRDRGNLNRGDARSGLLS